MSRKHTITAFLSRKFIITRFSKVFEDLLASSIAPQVMPPWNESKLTCNDSWWYKNSVWKRSRGHKKLVSSGAFENIAHGAWSYKIYVWKKRSRGHKKLASSGAQRADRRGRQLKSSGMMNSNCLPWTPQFFTEPDQPRSSQIFQDGETVIFSCEDTPEEAFQICCMTTTRNVVLLWSSLWFYSQFYLPIVTSSKCSIW